MYGRPYVFPVLGHLTVPLARTLVEAWVAQDLLSNSHNIVNIGDNSMTLLSKEDLMALTARRSGWHVSLFLPMNRAGVETLQNPVRCRICSVRPKSTCWLVACGHSKRRSC